MTVTANWLAAAKKTPSAPIVVVEIESGTGTVKRHNLQSDWNAATSKVECDVFDRGDGTGGICPKLYKYDNTAGIRWETGGLPTVGGFVREIYPVPVLTTPSAGFFESVTGKIKSSLYVLASYKSPIVINGQTVAIDEASGYIDGTTAPTFTIGHGITATPEAPGAAVIPAGTAISPGEINFTTAHKPFNPVFQATAEVKVSYSDKAYANPHNVGLRNDSSFVLTYRSRRATFTTAAIDMGLTPTNASVINLLSRTPGGSQINITAYTSANGSTWSHVGTVRDGGSIAAARYYKFDVEMICSVDSPGNLKVPELYEIRIVGGDAQYEYYSTSTDVTVPGYTVRNHLKSVSGISSRIGLKDKATVGDLTVTLNWLKEASSMAAGTQRKRSIRAYLGFEGLAWADYAPYFTGVWDSLAFDDTRREITLKVRDVWKLFKKKIPEVQFTSGKATTEAYQISAHIIDAIMDVAEKTMVPDRFVDTAAFASLKTASYGSGNWQVKRTFTDPEESDTLMNELAVSAGLFLIPGHDGKLRPSHYDTAISGAVAATLDAGRYKFGEVTTDFGETVTQTRIYYALLAGQRGSSVKDYGNVYLLANAAAESDRDERVPLEWQDRWGLSAGDTAKTGTALTKLADRLMAWYCPTTTIDSKTVAIAAYQVSVSGLPLYYFDLSPGQVVAVDNLRLPAPLAQWGGYSSGTKFLVMGKKVDTKTWTISLDLRQVGPVSYSTSTTWYSYDHDIPAVTPSQGPVTLQGLGYTGDPNANRSEIVNTVVQTTDPKAPLVTFTRGSVAYKQDGTQVAANRARIEPGPWPGSSALMVEEATSNLLSQANSFDQSPWTITNAGSVVQNAIGPDGTMSAWTLTDSDAANYTVLTQAATVTVGQPVCFSVFVKKQAIYTASIAIWPGSLQEGNRILDFNPTTGVGVPQQSTSFTQFSVEEYGDFWRIAVWGTAGAATTNFRIYPAINNDGSNVNTATATGSNIIWGAQVEQKAYPTSWINGTRSTEVCSLPTSGLLLPSVGTIEAWVYREANITASRYLIGEYYGGERLYLSATATGWSAITGNTATTVSSTAGTDVGWHHLAVTWSSSALTLYVDGAAVTVANPDLPTSLPAAIHLGHYFDGSASTDHLNGPITSLRFSSIARTADEIAASYLSRTLIRDQYTTWTSDFAPDLQWYNPSSGQLQKFDGITWDQVSTKNTIYQQTSMPTGGTYTVNDEWIDSDSSPLQVYRWNGSSWVVKANNIGAGDVSTSLIASEAATALRLSSGNSNITANNNNNADGTQGAVILTKALTGLSTDYTLNISVTGTVKILAKTTTPYISWCDFQIYPDDGNGAVLTAGIDTSYWGPYNRPSGEYLVIPISISLRWTPTAASHTIILTCRGESSYTTVLSNAQLLIEVIKK